MLRWKSVRLRLTVWNVLAMAILVGISGLALCEQERYELARSIDRELVVRVRAADMTLPPLPSQFPPLVEESSGGNTPVQVPFPTPTPADEAGVLVPPRFLTTDGHPWIRGLQRPIGQ